MLSICQFLYDDFVSPATSATNLQILSDLHDAVPYFLIKQILNLPTSMLGTKAQKMIISNLMIKSLDILLQDEGIDAKLSDLKLRIGSFALCRKLEDFVLVASKKDRAVVTEFASEFALDV